MNDHEYHTNACGDLRCPCYQAGLRADVAEVVARQATELEQLREFVAAHGLGRLRRIDADPDDNEGGWHVGLEDPPFYVIDPAEPTGDDDGR